MPVWLCMVVDVGKGEASIEMDVGRIMDMAKSERTLDYGLGELSDYIWVFSKCLEAAGPEMNGQAG